MDNYCSTKKESIYVSLDEAREELARRHKDKELMKKIEADLGDKLWPIFKGRPCAVLPKYLPSPDNSFTFFVQMANYVGGVPVVLEFLGDKFVSFNEEKKGLGRLRVRLKNGEKFTIDVIDFQKNENKKISEIFTKAGQSLVDFHHDLLARFGYEVEMEDGTSWLHESGKKIDYYRYLLNFVAHGVLFEYYTEEDEYEKVFVHETVLPNIKKIYDNYGLKPLIIKLFPENQNDEEDFYWWSYPLNINDYIIEYAKKNKFILKPFLVNYDKEKRRISLDVDTDLESIKDPDVMFQRVMAIQSSLVADYYETYLGVITDEEKKEIKDNLQKAKIGLAYEIVKKYHGENEAIKSKEFLVRVISSEVSEIVVIKGEIKLVEFMVLSGFAKSNSDARRLIEQNGVKLDGKNENNWQRIMIKKDDGISVSVGRNRIAKIKFSQPRHLLG